MQGVCVGGNERSAVVCLPHTHMHTHVLMCKYTCTSTRIHTLMPAHACLHAHICTGTQAHIHTHTHTRFVLFQKYRLITLKNLSIFTSLI